jgi:hypothetical protein
MKRASLVASLALSATLFSTGGSPTASACENGYVIQVDPRTGAVSDAEKLVNLGKPDEAARRLLSVDRSFATATPGKSRLSDRALVVLAKAVVRSDGRVTIDEAKSGEARSTKAKTNEGGGASERNVAWSVGVLRALASKRSDDPGLASDLGEVLSRVPSEKAEARRVLESLEKRDVVASAYAYAALARLRAERASDAPAFLKAPLGAFESARRELELARCAGMTKAPSICRAGAAGS